MNPKVNIRVVIIISILFLGGCSKSPLCWGDNKNKGLIVSDVIINQPGCCDHDTVTENKHIINSEEEYYNLFDDIMYCDSSDLPQVDFKKYTMLGQYASGGCEVKFIREVTNDEKTHEYLYTITVRDCGACQVHVSSMNWVLVPKLPENYTVRFELNH